MRRPRRGPLDVSADLLQRQVPPSLAGPLNRPAPFPTAGQFGDQCECRVADYRRAREPIVVLAHELPAELELEPVDAGIIDGADTAQIIHREAGFPIFLKLEPVQVDICDSCDAGSVGILEATAYRVQQPDLAGFWVAHTQVGAQQPVVEIEQGKLRVREIAVRQLARHRKESSMLVSDQLIEELDELVNHSGILRRCVVAAQPDTAAELFGPANQIARRRTEAAEDLVQRTAQLHAE